MNFSISKTILSVACAAISVSALAGTADIKASNNQAGIQFISTDVNYKETGNGTVGAAGVTMDTENGRVPGVALSASAMKDLWLGNDYIEAEYSRNSGHTNYVGAAQGGVFGSARQSDGATIIDYHLRYGKGFIMGAGLMLTPYGEIGHHNWDRNVNLGETYTNYYYGIGVLGQYSPVEKLVLSANGLIGRTAKSNIDVTGFGSARLGNSNLYRIGVSADYALTQNIHANAGVDYTSFDYSASAIQPGAWAEPDSTSRYTTVKVGLGYTF